MKPIFTFFLVLIFANSVLAQQAKKAVPSINAQHHQALHELLQYNKASLSSERTMTTTYDTLQRVIAQSTRDSTTGMTDSIKLSYHGIEFSTYDYNDMIYTYNYPYNQTPMFNFKGAFTKPQVQYDTFMHWAISPITLLFGYYETWYAGYDSNTNLTAFKKVFVDSTINQNVNFVNTFNTLNNITSGKWYNDNLGVSDSAFQQYFAYNTSNKLIEDSVFEYHRGAWHIVSKTYYTYNPLGDLVQIDCYANDTDTTFSPTFPEQAKYTNTYDGSHRLHTVATSIYNGTSLNAFATDTFSYATGAVCHTTWVEWEYDVINGYWTPFYKMTKQINVLGLPDTISTQSWDSVMNSWVPQSRFIPTYNIRNNPDTLREFDYNFTYYPSRPSYITVYYYNTYIDTIVVFPAAVASIANHNPNVTLYPNPATNELNLAIDNPPNNMQVVVTFVNTAGQTVLREYLPVSYGKATINTGMLASGMYAVSVVDASGNLLARQLIVKE